MSELTGPLVAFSGGATTVTNTTAQHVVGSKGRDALGNEYLYVRFTDANYGGGWCVLDGAFNATREIGRAHV